MAVLQKMRDKFGIAISIIIALSLLYFIAPMDDLMTIFGAPQNVGEIDGKSVSYEAFQAEIDNQNTVNQIITGSTAQSEQTRRQIREAAWQEFVNKYLFIEKAKDAGIAVGAEEMKDLTTGNNVHPLLAQNPAFCDAEGNYDPEALIEFVQNLDSDKSGNLRTFWNFIQNTIRTQTFNSKYMSLFVASNFENALMSERDIVAGNTSGDIEYVRVALPIAKDSTISVSKGEISAYYNNHKKDYKRLASRDIEYVVYEVSPSADDIDAVREEMEEAYDEFAGIENTGMRAFLLKNSSADIRNYERWYADGELRSVNAEVNTFVSANTSGTSPIFKTADKFFAARVMNVARIPDSVYVKHILLQGTGVKATADSIVTAIRGGSSFTELVEKYSADKGSADEGQIGNIGWLTQNYMIPGFESTLAANVGEPVVLKTQYGTHIVVVTRRSTPITKKQVAVFSKDINPSNETINEYYGKANLFASIADGSYEGFLRAIDSLKVYSTPMNNVLESNLNYGAISDAREVTQKVFDTKKGKATQVISVNNKYFFVVAVKNVNKAGIAPLSDVYENINSILYSRKLREKVIAETAAKISGCTTMEQVAQVLNSTVETREGVSPATRDIDPSLASVVAFAPEGSIYGPVSGYSGIFVAKVANRQTGEFFTAEDAQSGLDQKSMYSTRMVIPEMMMAADVVDNRAHFY